MILLFIMDLGDAEVELLALPPSGGGSSSLEPNGSKINDILIYIIICMYVCMYVCMYQGRFKVGIKVRIVSVGYKVRIVSVGIKFASLRSGSSSGTLSFCLDGRTIVLGSEFRAFRACTRSHVHTGCCSPRECSHPPAPHRCS